MLSERLRPKNISELIGNEQSRLELVKWLKHWKLGSKSVFLIGPPGVGKSTSVYAVAREFGYEVIEFNASDVRTREKLRTTLGPALVNSSVFGPKEKIMVFLDEVDGLSGRSDYAGSEFILDFIENTTIPVVLAANVEDDPKLRKLEQKSIVLRFEPVDEQLLHVYLKMVSKREHLKSNDAVLRKIASKSRGDVRYALNLLQSLATDEDSLGQTDRQFFSDANAIDEILSSKTLGEAVVRFSQFDASPYDKIRAIYDNVVSAKTMSIEEKAESLELVALADILLARITREQNWRLLRYLNKYLALAILNKGLKRTESALPWNLRLAIWNDGRVVKGLQQRFSYIFHVAKSDFSIFYLPFISIIFKNNPKMFEAFSGRYELLDPEKRVIAKFGKVN
jgi:replication factor C large subunit